jgi:hypothetical protein
MRYLSGVTNASVEAVANLEADMLGLGVLVQPDTAYIADRLGAFPFYAIDNGCYAKGEQFDLPGYLDWLRVIGQRPDVEQCLFATAPDVVGDALATLARSLPVLPLIRAAGLPAAFVAQDGSEAPGLIPWSEIDAVFLGGSTEWKLSPAAEAVVSEARRRGKWVHMGRVNSLRRLQLAESWGCDSADGTMIAFGPSENLAKLCGWLAEVNDYTYGYRGDDEPKQQAFSFAGMNA